jgi:hypothetical protein
MIDQDQVDISFNYPTQELTIFINGVETTHYHFSPTRAVFSIINMIQIAVEVTEKYRKRKAQEEKNETTNL